MKQNHANKFIDLTSSRISYWLVYVTSSSSAQYCSVDRAMTLAVQRSGSNHPHLTPSSLIADGRRSLKGKRKLKDNLSRPKPDSIKMNDQSTLKIDGFGAVRRVRAQFVCFKFLVHDDWWSMRTDPTGTFKSLIRATDDRMKVGRNFCRNHSIFWCSSIFFRSSLTKHIRNFRLENLLLIFDASR